MSTHIDVIAARLGAASAGGKTPRVRWNERAGGSFHSFRRRGHIQRATGSSIWVMRDGQAEATMMRANRNGFVDVDLLTQHELELERWAEEMPETAILRLTTTGLGVELFEPGARFTFNVATGPRQTITPEQLTELASEATVIAAWLERRPESEN